MKAYLDGLRKILEEGVDRPDRTGVGTRALFGLQMRYNLADGFPVVTTKKLAFKSMTAELLWFIRGSRDVRELQQLGSHIWDANAHADYWTPRAQFEGDVGRIYGVQWRSWRTPDGREIDQLKQVIEGIRTKPYSRRHVVTAWNPGELEEMALPPCHILYQFFVANGTLSLHMFQRSCDMFLGVPFNIASYSLLLHMVAQVTGLKPGEFVHTLSDAHIYQNHFEQVKAQLARKPKSLPTLRLNPEIKDIDAFTMDDIRLENYHPHPAIRAPMAV